MAIEQQGSFETPDELPLPPADGFLGTTHSPQKDYLALKVLAWLHVLKEQVLPPPVERSAQRVAVSNSLLAEVVVGYAVLPGGPVELGRGWARRLPSQ